MTDSKDASQSGYTYAKAGVSIAAGNALVKAIAPLARATARPGANAALGGFGAFVDPPAAGYKEPLLVAAPDGLGTKPQLRMTHNRHSGRAVALGMGTGPRQEK